MPSTLPLGPTHRPLHDALLPLPVVMKALSLRREAVAELVESGGLRWVWNAARVGACRVDYRFWKEEVGWRAGKPQPAGAAQLTLAEVVERVIERAPGVTLLHSESVADIMWTTRTRVHGWLDRKEMEGWMVNGRQFVTRASLAAFLTRRIVN